MIRTCTRKAHLSRQAHANLDDFLNQARWLYNESLAERRDAWKDEEKSISYARQTAKLTRRRKDPSWSRFSARAQRSVLKRLDRPIIALSRREAILASRVGVMAFDLLRKISPPKLSHQESIIPTRSRA